MNRARWWQGAGVVVAIIVFAWGTTRVLERLVTPSPDAVEDDAAPVAGDEVGHIAAVLFYATDDGQALMGVNQDVPLATGDVPQGRAILDALFAPAPAPYTSVIPDGTTLRAFYVTERGDAFVDLSPEASTNHPGGSFAELLTVYAIVNTVAANLPAVQRVQILVDGREAETLTGHVDLRRPLVADPSFVRDGAPSP